MPIATFRPRLVLGLLAFCAAIDAGAATETVSAWSPGRYSSARLIDGGLAKPAAANAWRAGLEIRLATGWKTYWRYPGDSGVPLRIDFSASENVRSVDVLWPAPMRFEDGGGTSIGYAQDVVLPLRIEAREHGQAVHLRLNVDYAVCEKLCVPVDASLELRLDPKASPSTALEMSEARVPRRTQVGDDGPLAILSVRKDANTSTRMIVDVKSPAGERSDLFVEGPDADWALPVPELLEDAPGNVRRFGFSLDGAPPGKSFAGAALRLTAAGPSAAIETIVYLD
ncbi:MAG: hypothetical protein QOD74_2034 [Variibacter sp.]|nr:hypothetical protein [Variibacter sp.]